MPKPPVEDRYRIYREALRRRVCAVCLDSRDDGACSLDGALACAIEEHLPALVDVVLGVNERHDDAYAAAVEARVCSGCGHNDGVGPCRLRRDGRCALALYLPIIVEAITEAEARRDGGSA